MKKGKKIALIATAAVLILLLLFFLIKHNQGNSGESENSTEAGSGSGQETQSSSETGETDPGKTNPTDSSSDSTEKQTEGSTSESGETSDSTEETTPSEKGIPTVGQNLALKAGVKLSGYKVTNAGVYPLSMINDGNHESNNQGLLTWADGGYVEFDLGDVCEVTGYRIYSYDWPAKYSTVTKWTILGSEDGKTFTVLDKGEVEDASAFGDESTQYLNGIREGVPDGINFDQPAKVRYIRYQADEVFRGALSPAEPAPWQVRMYDFEIWGEPGPNWGSAGEEEEEEEEIKELPKIGTNIAPQAFVYASYGCSTLSRLTDGVPGLNAEGKLDSNGCATLNWTDDGALFFDFGAVSEITGYRIYNYEWPNQYTNMKSWKVYVSNDSSNWTQVGSGKLNPYTPEQMTSYHTVLRNGIPDGENFASPVKARYFKLVADSCIEGQNAKDQVKMYEFEIYGTLGAGGGHATGPTPPATIGENLALASRGTTIRTTYPTSVPTQGPEVYYRNGDWTSPLKRLIDGNTNLDASTAVLLPWTADGYILLDLQKVCELTGYRLYPYRYAYQWCIVNKWSVYTSVDGKTWTKQHTGSLDTAFFKTSGSIDWMVQNGHGINFANKVDARYVKLVADEVFVGAGGVNGTAKERTDAKDVRYYEFQVWGNVKAEQPEEEVVGVVAGDPIGKNVALAIRGTTIEVNNLTVQNDSLKKINDGKNTVADDIAAFTWADNNSMVFDLKESYELTGYRIYGNESAGKDGLATKWGVWVSEDGFEWTKMDAQTRDASGWTEDTKYFTDICAGKPDGGNFKETINARYVKFSADKANKDQVRMYEFEIYANVEESEYADTEGETIEEMGAEASQQALIETALAYFAKNPYIQFNNAIFRDALESYPQSLLATRGLTPEMIAADNPYYSEAAGFVADIYNAAFGLDADPGLSLFKDDANSIAKQYKKDGTVEYAEMLQYLQNDLQPGDIIAAVKAEDDSSYHVVLFLGDCLGDGKNYVLQSWPTAGGGSMGQKGDPSIEGRHLYEANGAAVLQTLDELFFTEAEDGSAAPNWPLANADDCAELTVLRPLTSETFKDVTQPDATYTRLTNPGLVIEKTIGKNYTDSVMTEDQITVTITVKNTGDADYDLIEMTETLPEGAELVASSIKGGGTQSGSTITWGIRTKAGETTTLSYKLKITAEAGATVELPEGSIGGIATRGYSLKVGMAKLDDAKIEAMAALATEIPEDLAPETFEGLAFINTFYKKMLNMGTNLPKESAEFFEALFDADETLTLKAEVDDFYAGWDFMRINKSTFGYEVVTEDAALELKEEFYTVGDVFVVMNDSEEGIALTDENMTIYFYLGNDNVLAYSKADGLKADTFAGTVGKALLKDLVIGLRPTLFLSEPEPESENLALASRGTKVETNMQQVAALSFINDGDHASTTSKQSIHSWEEGGYYIFDLGTLCMVKDYNLWFYRWGLTYGAVENFTIYGSEDGETWTEIGKGTNTSPEDADDSRGYTMETGKFKAGTQARFVKFAIDTAITGSENKLAQCRFYEIEIFGYETPKTLTVKYQFADGTQAAEPVTQTLAWQEPYQIESPAVQGYVADKALVYGKMGPEAEEITVTYSGNTYKAFFFVDGVLYDTKEIASGAAIVLPETTPTKEGYTFSGWLNVPETMPAGNLEIQASFGQGENLALASRGTTVNNTYTKTHGSTSETRDERYLNDGEIVLNAGYDNKHTSLLDKGNEAQSVIFDLQSSCVVTGYRLYNFDFPLDYGGTKTWIVSVSEDGKTWTKVSEGAVDEAYTDKTMAYTTTFRSGQPDGEDFAGVRARYVKLQCTAFENSRDTATPKAKPIRISEFQILGWEEEVEETEQTLTINYVDKDGKAMEGIEPYSAKVMSGSAYSVKSPAVTGYTVNLETVEGTMPGQDWTLEVVYTPVEYTLRFTVNGEDYVDPITLFYGDPITAPEVGEIFGTKMLAKWIDLPATMPAAHLTVEAELREKANVALATTGTRVYTNMAASGSANAAFLLNDGIGKTDSANVAINKWVEGGYFLFDFGRPVVLDSYMLNHYLYPSSYGGWKKWTMYGSVDGVDFTKICEGAQTKSSLSESTKIQNGSFEAPVALRYLKVVLDEIYTGTASGGPYVQSRMYEVEFYGWESTEFATENLALSSRGTELTTTYPKQGEEGTEAWISTTKDLTYAINDGNFKSTAACSRNLWTEDGSIIFDLKDVCRITNYRIFNYEWPWQWCANNAWTVYTSLDGENWSKVDEGHPVVDLSTLTGSVDYILKSNGTPEGKTFEEPVIARYVKLVVDEVVVGGGVPSSSGTPYQEPDYSSKDVRMYEFQIFGWSDPTLNPQTVTVHYVDENGEKVAEDYIGAALPDEALNVASPEIAGMTPDKAAVTDIMPAKAFETTVVYTANEYKLTFMADGKQFGDVQTVKYGAAITPATGVTCPAGYTFLGWKDMPETMPAEDLTLEAEFIENTKLSNLAPGSMITVTGYTNVANTPAKLIDEVEATTDNRWKSAQQWAATWTEDGSIVFDLLSVKTVTGYRMHAYEYPTQWGHMDQWSVYGSVDNATWTLLDQAGYDYSGTGVRHVNDGSDFDMAYDFRYIKLVADHAKAGVGNGTADVPARENPEIRLCEFQILGIDNNLALASKGTRVSTTYPAPEGSYTNDKGDTVYQYLDKNGNVQSPIKLLTDGKCANGLTVRYQWTEEGYILFDLQRECTIDSVYVYNYKWPWQWCMPIQWSVYTSLDGEDYTKQLTVKVDATAWETSSAERVSADGGAFETPVDACFVKIVVEDVFVGPGISAPEGAYSQEDCNSKDIRMYEVGIFGTEKPSDKYALSYKINGTIYGDVNLVKAGDPIVAPDVAGMVVGNYMVRGWKNVPETMPANALTIEAELEEKTNVALASTGTKVDSNMEPNGAAYNKTMVNDGSNNSNKATTCFYGKWTAGQENWILFDFGREVTVSNYTVWNYKYGTTYGNLKSWSLYSSDDGMTFTKFAEGASPKASWADAAYDNNIDGSFETPVTTRYIKLVVDEINTGSKNSDARVYEVEFFGWENVNGPENLAAAANGGKVSLSEGMSGSTTYLVDGDHETNSSKVSIQNWVEGGYYLFDLGADCTVTGVDFYCYKYPQTYGGMQSFTVFGSMDGEIWTEIPNYSVMTNVKANVADKQNMNHLSVGFNSPAQAKYIKIVIDSCLKGTHTSVTTEQCRFYEIEVMGWKNPVKDN